MPRRETTNLDLSSLYDMTIEQPKIIKKASATRIKLAEVQDRFTRIAFDLFRDSQSEYIWKLEKDSETGEEYIIRTAQLDPLYQKVQNWSSEVDFGKTAITLVYKDHAIKAFKTADLNIQDNQQIEDWRRFLIDKIATDPTFLSKVLANIGESRRRYILGKYPELNK